MRVLATFALAVLLLTGGCTDRNGEFDAGNTALLGLGAAAAVGAAVLLSDDNDKSHDRGHRARVAQRRDSRAYQRGYDRRDDRRGWR